MKHGGKALICLLGGIALATNVEAVTNNPGGEKGGDAVENADENPYSAIVERNVFDLKPPAKAGLPDPTTNTPPLNIRLTGITTILGNKRALFMVQEGSSPGKRGQPQNKEESYIMTEGQRQGALEVLEIDVKGAKVKVKNDGVVSTIPIEVPKPQTAAGGPAAGAAGINPPGGRGPRTGPGLPAGKPGLNFNGANGSIQLPPRALRTAPGLSQNGFSPAPAFQGGLLQGGTSPQVALNPGATPTTPTLATPGQPGLSAEEQVILAEAQQQLHQAEIQAGRFPTLPPIPGVTGLQVPVPEPPQITYPAPPLGQKTTGNFK